jgi:tagaturonate reductase
MQLSRSIVKQLADNGLAMPDETIFSLPEKVLQFGTGVLLRGLPDYFIDKANKQGLFNGRVVVVKSTANGGTDAFRQQDGLYTLLERGVENGQRIERTVLNAAISRVLSATEQLNDILACATNPAMQVIISNTTEVGITLVADDATTELPASFPGKLLLFLLKRYEAFNGDKEAGMVIIPTELIVDNGTKLKTIVSALAKRRGCGDAFMDWLHTANDFCNSLVDRIVPGKLSREEATAIQEQLGYEDELMIMSECYRLWAIETTSERTKKILSFSKADTGVVLAPGINKFRELKLRLLNGTHTFSCGLACLAGFATVKEAMQDKAFGIFISKLMLHEIVPLVVSDEITATEAESFATAVADRFRNTYIEHRWLNITLQYTLKMAARNVPLIQKHYLIHREAPELMALGFAAYILFMRSALTAEGSYAGQQNGKEYVIQDDKASVLHDHWKTAATMEMVRQILKDVTLWTTDLTQYEGFTETVDTYLALLMKNDALTVLRAAIREDYMIKQ